VYASSPARRIPLNTLAIQFGLVGLAQVWSVATVALGGPLLVAQAWWLLAGGAWVVTVIVHARHGRRAEETVGEQLRHLTLGPLAALLPIGAMLLGAGLHRSFATAGTVLTVAAVAAAASLAGWLAVHWARADLTLDLVHGGHYLPMSAAGLVGALAAGSVGLRGLAIGCFAFGGVFWVVTTVLIGMRLVRYPDVPDMLVPTLAILTAPPAVAAVAWSTIGRAPDVAFVALTAITVVMVGVQLCLLPRYLSLRFSVGFWSFTFPTASVTGLAITWLRLEKPWAWRETSVALVVMATGVVALVAAKSVAQAAQRDRGTG
jgi:tellurite resistance protein